MAPSAGGEAKVVAAATGAAEIGSGTGGDGMYIAM